MNFILGDQVSGQICELDAKFDYAGMDTSNLEVNALYSVKRSFTRNTKDSKKEIPTENGGESYLVAGVVLPGLRPSEYHFGGVLLMKALFAYAHYGLFPSVPYKSKLLTALNTKSPDLRSRLSLVAGVGLSKMVK